MTNDEFREAVEHHQHVKALIENLLNDNGMSLTSQDDGTITLTDDRRDIGYTGLDIDLFHF